MKLDDVLAMAGEHQLSGFDWGASVVILYNGLVPTENHIDVSHTGKEAFEKLRLLPSSTLVAVLMREVQIEGTTVDFIGTAAERSQNVPPTIPTGHKRMSPVALVLMTVLTVIAMAMTFSTFRNPDKPVNVEALKAVLATMTDLMKEENRSNQAPPAETPPVE